MFTLLYETVKYTRTINIHDTEETKMLFHPMFLIPSPGKTPISTPWAPTPGNMVTQRYQTIAKNMGDMVKMV